MTHRLASLAAVACALSFAPAVDAAPKPKIALRLDYQPPTPEGDCPDAEELSMALAGEFGYLVVRPDAPSRLRVQIRREGRSYVAELWGPDASGREDAWHTLTDKQGSCRELGYDLSSVVKIALGPTAWTSETPPPWLAAPPELEVGRPWLEKVPLQFRDSLATVAPPPPTDLPPTAAKEVPPFRVEGALGAVISPLALPKVGVGGSVLFGVRWPYMAMGLDIRGLITASPGVGENEVGGRTSLLTVSFLPCAAIRFLDVCAIAAFSDMKFDVGSSLALRTADGFSTGFGLRLAPRWAISERFTLLAFGDVTAELRTIALRSQASAGPNGPPPDWVSPMFRVSLGGALAITLLP